MDKGLLRIVRRENLKRLIDDSFSGRQADLALAAKKNATQINHWVSGHRNPNGDTCREVEKELGLPENWLDKDNTAIGTIDKTSSSNQATALMGRAVTAINLIEDIYPVEFSIPLLSWVRAGAFCEAPGSFTREDAQELLPRPLFRTGPNTFALTVVGDSMDVPDGYREGEIVYIDPDIEPTPGKDVLAKTGNKMTLKRYKVDEDGPYLLQLNGNKIIRPTGDWSVCGVVVYAGRRC